MAVPGFFFKIEHGLFRVIGLKLAGEPQGVFDLSRFSLLPFIVPPYFTVYPKVSLLVGLKEVQTQVLSFYVTVIH